MVDNIRFDITARDETTRAFRQIDANLNRTMAGFRKFEAGIVGFRGQLGTALAATAGATGLLYLEKRFVDMGSKIGDTADKIGLTSTELQELHYAAQMAGVETETLDASMLVFTRNLGMAELGLGKARGALEDLGIGFDAIKGQSPAEILGRVADALARVEDPMKRNALAAQLLGRAGAQLGPLLSAGSAGLNDYADAAHNLGVIVGADVIRANQEAGDSFDTIGTAIDVAGMNISAGFLPAIREIEAIMTSAGLQTGLRDAASGVAEFVERAIENYDKLAAVVGVLGRLYVAFQAFKVGNAVGGPVLGGAAAVGGYFSPEIAERLSTAGDGRAPLDADPNIGGKKPLTLDVTKPANQAEIDAYNATRDTLRLGLAKNAAKKGDWSGEDWLGGGDGFTSGGYGGGGGGGKGRSGSGAGRRQADSVDQAQAAIDRVSKSLEQQRAMLGLTGREQMIYNEQLSAGVDDASVAGQQIRALAGAYYDQRDAIEATQRAIQVAHDITYDFASGVVSDLRNGVTAAEALGNAFDRLADRLIDMALDQAINGLFANLSKSGGAGSVLGIIGSLFNLGAPAAGGVFADGGWTGGGGRGQVAGVVHGQEFVVNAAATSRNRAVLEAINDGRPGFAGGGYAGPDGGSPQGRGDQYSILVDLRGTTGDGALDHKIRMAAEQSFRASVQVARRQASAWVADDWTNRNGEWRT